MVKRVYTNCDDVIHIWAQQPNHNVRCSNVFSEGQTLYSYGYHYPLAHFLDDKTVLINAAGYSVTTSKHIGKVRYATNHYKQFVIHDNGVMSDLARQANWDQKSSIEATLNYAISCEVSAYIRSLAADTVKRKQATLEKKRNSLLSTVQVYIDLLAFWKLKLSKENRKELARIANVAPSDILTEAKKAKEKADKAKVKEEVEKQKALQALADQLLPAWRQGIEAVQIDGKNYYPENTLRQLKEVYLRVVGDMVQTSKGASFPLEHGLKALPFIRKVVASGETWQKNGHTIHLGYYQIDTISADHIKAGCHIVPVAEVEQLANSLGY